MLFVYVFVHILVCVTPFNPLHIVVMLFCFVAYALFGVTGRVEARLSVGFSLSSAEVFPWHIVWAHECLNLVIYSVSFSWPLAVSLVLQLSLLYI